MVMKLNGEIEIEEAEAEAGGWLDGNELFCCGGFSLVLSMPPTLA